MGAYLKQGIFERDPFVTIDQEGVGQLIDTAVREIRQVDPNIVIGICGDHANDPESLRFFHSLNVDHISCTPESIENARLLLAEIDEPILL